MIVFINRQINDENYFGSHGEANDLKKFMEQNDKKSISDLLDIFLVIISNKWSKLWPTSMIQVYMDVFKRVW